MKTQAVILAGGEGARLSVLTDQRAKPAVPFAGKYRIIDFTLSNCVNAGIFDVIILAQYQPHSLVRHIGAGGPWDLNRDFTGGVHVYTPYTTRSGTDWYVGTADAVEHNFSFIKQASPDLVLILSGDHIYTMDYQAMIAFHIDHQADMTMATASVPIEQASRFGIVGVGEDCRVNTFVEKPQKPPSNLINMGVYVFNAEILNNVLWHDHQRSDTAHDFGKDIVPQLLKDGASIYAYPYSGYWMDVGTIQAYWQAHMDLLANPPLLDLNNRNWVIHTRTEERPPMRIGHLATIDDSLISNGCIIETGAVVQSSVLSPGVTIRKGARVCQSVVLTNSTIESGALVCRAIIDKSVRIGENSVVGSSNPVDALVVIGKHSDVPAETVVEPGAVIGADVVASDYSSHVVGSKEILLTKRQTHEI